MTTMAQQGLAAVSSAAASTVSVFQNTLSQIAASSTAQISTTISTSSSTASALKSTLSTAQSSIVALRFVAETSIISGNKAIQGIQESIEAIAVLTSLASEQSGLDDVYFSATSGADDSTAFISESSNAYSTTTGIFPAQEASRAVVDASNLSAATTALVSKGIANTVNPITSEVSRANSAAATQVAAAAITSTFLKQAGTSLDNAAW